MMRTPFFCYFCGKTRHMTSRCRDRPKKGTISTFMANTKRPKKIWVPKKNIIPVANVLDSNKQMHIMVPREWLLMAHDRSSNVCLPIMEEQSLSEGIKKAE